MDLKLANACSVRRRVIAQRLQPLDNLGMTLSYIGYGSSMKTGPYKCVVRTLANPFRKECMAYPV
jgi:hypothetical protein